jgi:hypothetical protein
MIKLKTVFLLFFGLTLTPLTLFGQLSLTIEIIGLRNNDGQVFIELSNEKGEKIMGITQKIVDSKCAIIIKNLTSANMLLNTFMMRTKIIF